MTPRALKDGTCSIDVLETIKDGDGRRCFLNDQAFHLFQVEMEATRVHPVRYHSNI